ncbi:hypothetical protein Agabi119p4_250 [Agaricus bisporus var. burnettii]|uniref:Uncharacterized protein n=1 Tax=Agaricus bisporus var. burnettii TaxID=192524 RepID=A0A8H7FAF4_AGABI|nr:hypothetical protein Agabi119p4_250 [Agaricus bisporus var. burnettii]
MSSSLANLTPLFLALQISGGQVGLPIIIATLVLSKKVARHPTLINFFCTWVIYSIVFCLLLYSGGQGRPASEVLCQVQSVLIHGASPMCGVATLALVIQFWVTMQESPAQQQLVTLSRSSRWPATLRLRILLVLPYAVFVVFILATTLLQRRSGVEVISNGLYCTMHELSATPIVGYGVPAFCTATLIAIVGFEVAIAIRYFRMLHTISSSFPLADTKKSPVMIIRVLVLSVYTLVSLISGVLFLSQSQQPWPYMVQAALPLFAFLVFGMQKDIILVWRFWKPYPVVPPFDIPLKHPPHHHPRCISVISIDTAIFNTSPTSPLTNV